MNYVERVEKAIHGPDSAQALRALVHELSAEGLPKTEIITLLEKAVPHLRASEASSDADEDTVLDVLDALTGWCHPDAKLLSDP